MKANTIAPRPLGALDIRHRPSDRVACQPRIEHRFIRFSVVRDRTGLSRSTIWRMERSGSFPRHHRISLGAVGWLESEVDQWVLTRISEGAPKEATGPRNE